MLTPKVGSDNALGRNRAPQKTCNGISTPSKRLVFGTNPIILTIYGQCNIKIGFVRKIEKKLDLGRQRQEPGGEFDSFFVIMNL